MKSPSDPFLGKRIREYEILALIGQGRMGAVYRARHVLLEQERAIKVVQTGMAGSSELADRFIREARILARMQHPNLVDLYEFGQLEEGTFFMILELLQGESVRRRVDTLERIPALDAVRIAREAASGLHVAHSTGILHRDVSPDNLFLIKNEAGEEVTKVIDFAIAKPTVQEARTMQSTQVLMGRPEFWSPEQFGIGGQDAPLDRRTDIYSLGVTLYYMITGKLPFVSLVPKGTPEAITTYDVPPKLERVIRKALSIDRESRQDSMMELIQELDEVTYREVVPTIQVAPGPPAPARFQPGFVFAGRYEIQKKIGKGGMGTVFKALDRILDIPVALKTMNPEISTDEKTLARLKREVILARKVAHPNVCRLYDIGECDGIHYVSMEFVEGMTLSDMLLLRGKLPPAEGLQILRQVLLALQEAHRARVIHRDLKPQNIMVDVHQRAFIMDFGISFSADVERLTTTGMMIGTPRYMAPEQFGETP
ncbi:MAG TPA: serine/threonine-protein kinase, partial [Acidobacteriota bacterium]|nr:serine/threonine-protein kinase [Acidobacteriota bacterium]